MIEEIKLLNWNDFSVQIAEIRKKYLTKQIGYREGILQEKNTILFRGQENASWPITTTLDRKVDGEFDLIKYMELVLSYSQEIEAYTNHKWNLPNIASLEEQILSKQSDHDIFLPYKEYLIYLRQYGFPSPLLDWSLSPYIAAYFALSGEKTDEPSAVYAYIERTSMMKSYWVEGYRIKVIDPHVNTHKRHFTQQAWYTIATIWKENEKRRYFSSHQAVLTTRSTIQDIFIKIIIPPSVRKNALIELNDYNINPYTLFHTEDSLIKTMAMKAFDL